MAKRCYIVVVTLFFIHLTLVAQQTFDLAGKWQVTLDTLNELVRLYPDRSTVSGTINLPGSLAEEGYGVKSKGSDFGILTPEYEYVGMARYSREIEIPATWKNKEVEIILERVLWESRVYIDGKEMSKQDALGTPHYHQIGRLTPGRHLLTIAVDNEMIHNIGDKGHAYGAYTQSIWNGIVGRMEMRGHDPFRILNTKVYPNIRQDELLFKINLQSKQKTKAQISYEITELDSEEVLLFGSEIRKLTNVGEVTIRIPNQSKMQKWSEFTPVVYVLKTSVKAGKYVDTNTTEFGFYQVSKNRSKLLINGQPIFLRGNLDCVHFPLTGYPSCNVDDWVRIFNIYKEYGLNHARFHSWCPPEAAFKAANRVGIYLQAESSIWIDWWMSTDMVSRGRPEMDTKGHPKGLGYDIKRDQFVIEEMNRVVEEYGNHPSFVMFCIGNELGNSDFEVMKKWVADLKKKDPRRLYAVSTARVITEVDDYNATHYIQNIGSTRGLRGAHTNWDFDTVYAKMDIPIIAHEIGQWPVYPQWNEIQKYQGVLKARNLEGFKSLAKKNGIVDQDVEFAMASGALNQIMYKYETESFLRTASCAGVQLLSMQDYQGQGEALIGWLDAFWDSKGITTPEKFRSHFTTTVPLLRMDKFVWTMDERYKAVAQLAHYGATPLTAETIWSITDRNGQVYAEGSFGEQTFALGSLNYLGEIEFELDNVKKAEKLTIRLNVDGTPYFNQWDIWVYPVAVKNPKVEDLLVVNQLDEKVKQVLDQGGKVLLIANELGVEETSVLAHFYPLYWSLTFFPGQGKTCIGLLLENEHPAFNYFPTSFHSDWQWESISKDAKGFILKNLPIGYRPIAQPVDDFHRNNKVGSIFELAVGKGKLLVCGYNVTSDLPVARQLRHSLLNYMNSKDFEPQYQADFLSLMQLLPYIPNAIMAKVSSEFAGAILYVNSAANVETKNANVPWDRELDDVTVAKETSYQVNAEGVWKDDQGSAWHGKEMELQINCPDGILGSLYIHFGDWSNQNRTGLLEFEGRKVKLGKHAGKGQWTKFKVMREDSNDGKLILNTKALTGPNLMITKVVLVKEF